MNECLQTGIVPQEWKDAEVVPLHKSSPKDDLDNYRGVSLLSHLGKIMERIILSRILKFVGRMPGCIPEEQFGFMPGRGTADAIMISRLVSASAEKTRQPLFKAYIDLQKAYDTVSREVLEEVLKRRGLPGKIIGLVMAFHANALATVRHKGTRGGTFKLLVGLKQGSVLSPILFNIFFGAVVWAWKRECHKLDSSSMKGIGVTMETRDDGNNVTVSLSQCAKSGEVPLWELAFADDMLMLASACQGLQTMMAIFDQVATAYGLIISTKKTKIMTNSLGMRRCKDGAEGAEHINGPTILVRGVRLQVVDKFRYLGSIESMDTSLLEELTERKNRMNYKYSQMAGRVFENRGVPLGVKILVFNTYVVPCALYACETWCPTRSEQQVLERAYYAIMLGMMFTKARRPGVSYEKFLDIAKARSFNIVPLEVTIRERSLRYLGHVLRQGGHRPSLLRKMLSATLTESFPRTEGLGCQGRRTGPRSAQSEALKLFKFVECNGTEYTQGQGKVSECLTNQTARGNSDVEGQAGSR